MKQCLFFDLDGTLWDALEQITTSWNQAMKKYNYQYDLDTIKSFMGLTPKETCPLAFKNHSLEEGLKLFDIVLKAEIDYLSKNPGKIYPNEDEVLSLLKEKYDLFIVSNCDKGYIENYLNACQKTQYFTDHVCVGDTSLDKWQNILYLKKKYQIDEIIYIGDTLKDKIEANKANVKFIHANYGFGKIDNEENEINSLYELIPLVEKLFNHQPLTKKEVIDNINPLILKGVCHRGLHNSLYIENGLKAFENALTRHMAIELDVHLSKDKKIIVCHDSFLKRVTNKDGIIEELTLEEIKNNYTLLNQEKIPTLDEVLSLLNEQIPIVLELKTYNDNYIELAKYVKEKLSLIKDKKNIMLISFDPRALLQFNNEGFMRSLLLGSTNDVTFKYYNYFESLDIYHEMLKEDIIKQYQKNHFVNVWTINSKNLYNKVINQVDTVTFENFLIEK